MDLWWCYIEVHRGSLEVVQMVVMYLCFWWLVVVVLAFGCLPYAFWGLFVGIDDVVLLSLVMFKWW